MQLAWQMVDRPGPFVFDQGAPLPVPSCVLIYCLMAFVLLMCLSRVLNCFDAGDEDEELPEQAVEVEKPKNIFAVLGASGFQELYEKKEIGNDKVWFEKEKTEHI